VRFGAELKFKPSQAGFRAAGTFPGSTRRYSSGVHEQRKPLIKKIIIKINLVLPDSSKAHSNATKPLLETRLATF